MKQEKLFDFTRNGDLIDAKKIILIKDSVEYIKQKQFDKWIYPTWKLDIFISKDCQNQDIYLKPIGSGSYAYAVGGRFSIKINKNVLTYYLKHSVSFGYFPTKEEAEEAIEHVIRFVEYRYSIKIKAKSDEGYMYNMYDLDDFTSGEHLVSEDGGLCTETVHDAVFMAIK